MGETAPLPTDWPAFVRAETVLTSPPLLPEIKLHLAGSVDKAWKALEDALRADNIAPPYWAFAWPGGQAIARYILDHPETVRGKRVMDMAAGSGLCGIAAVIAGAKSVTAVDIDPVALAAIAENARHNGVNLKTRDSVNLTKAPWWTDVIMAGDVCYEQPMAARMIHWLRLCREKNKTVLLGDPGRVYLPDVGLRPLHTYRVPTTREIEDSDERDAIVYEMFIPKE